MLQLLCILTKAVRVIYFGKADIFWEPGSGLIKLIRHCYTHKARHLHLALLGRLLSLLGRHRINWGAPVSLCPHSLVTSHALRLIHQHISSICTKR